MNLLRKYKINKITPVLNKTELEIIKFVDNKLNNLDLFKNYEYKDRIFYMNTNNTCILEFIENEYLYVRYDNFCGFLLNQYELDDNDIKSFIQYRVEKIYKLKIKKIYFTLTMSAIESEDVYSKINN